MSRLSPAHRSMLNNAKYRASRHECRGTFGTLVRGLLDADIENQPTRFEEEPSLFSRRVRCARRVFLFLAFCCARYAVAVVGNTHAGSRSPCPGAKRSKALQTQDDTFVVHDLSYPQAANVPGSYVGDDQPIRSDTEPQSFSYHRSATSEAMICCPRCPKIGWGSRAMRSARWIAVRAGGAFSSRASCSTSIVLR